MFLFLFLLFLDGTTAYLEETREINLEPEHLGISDSCALFVGTTNTTLQFHNGQTLVGDIRSDIVAVNQQCDLVVFGFPEQNLVKLWRPTTNNITEIRPEQNVIQTEVSRFGFSVDVQNQTWVVGAPGTTNNEQNNYKGATQGYAFVYEGSALHSCRSLYDRYGFPVEGGIAIATYKHSKDAYGYLKINQTRYNHVFTDNAPEISDRDMIAFQRVCIPRQLPYYVDGPLDSDREAYFKYQQFGYAVSLSGPLYVNGSSLYISAPGDTNRFMEDDDGENYGRVYVWNNYVYDQPNDRTLPLIPFWQMGPKPVAPPNSVQATYRAFGRAIAAADTTLAISSYPLYERSEKQKPFVFVYDCNITGCTPSPDKGISIDDIPENTLGYLTNDDMAYSDGKTRLTYIPSPSFQNNFIGKKIGVAGSNVIIPDPNNPYVYRFGTNLKFREKHRYQNNQQLSNVRFGTNTEHWILLNANTRITHLWPCQRGRTSAGSACAWKDKDCWNDSCVKCQLQYYSNDGWEEDCEPCRKNYTTYEKGQTTCKPFVPPSIVTISWQQTVNIILIICGGALFLYLSVIAWECFFVHKRVARIFNDKINGRGQYVELMT